MKKCCVIIVEGIIGAGKSFLTRELGNALGPTTLIQMEPDEKGDANPYLADFYQDPARWAFPMQAHLLQARYRQHLNAQWHVLSGVGHAILDRSYFGDTAFARLQIREGHMTEREYATYQSIYKCMTASVLLPNFCIRLLVNPVTSERRIRGRMEQQEGRVCERKIDLEYLKALEREIDHMAKVLQGQGVEVLNVPWDVEREDPEARTEAVLSLVNRINEYDPPDLFLEIQEDMMLKYHKRTV